MSSSPRHLDRRLRGTPHPVLHLFVLHVAATRLTTLSLLRPHVGINIMYTTRLLRGLYFLASRNPQFDIRKERPEYTNAFAQLYLQVARAESQLIESLDLDQKNESNTTRYVCSSLTTTLTGLQDAWLARSATYNIGIYVNSRVQSTLDLILFGKYSRPGRSSPRA
ncbi:hypothetical protein PHLCEN_2v6334 [Hermanssonia centrifuga]|uniref:Uncharacterized protein n=1 Tax=Hermanssonia centrifuga TaxID=98765 RepID=A0A2R6NZN9_9APHY|nr:hypothetical protein PHLCEN_2v6334 [Hermanssonia centrifuga]